MFPDKLAYPAWGFQSLRTLVFTAPGSPALATFIDCPPGLTDTSEQILRAADLVIVPVIPSPLARRALEAIEEGLFVVFE